MSINHTIHPIKPRRLSKSKWAAEQLCTISEQNGCGSVSMNSSAYKQQKKSKIQSKDLNYDHKGIIPLLNNSTRFSQMDTSRKISSKSQLIHLDRSKENIRRPAQSQLIIINNRKFITSKSRSRSPVVSYQPPSQIVVNYPLRSSNAEPRMHRVISKSKLNSKNVHTENSDEKQALYRKIDVLQKRISELHRQRQSSVVNLLKQNQNLKEQLQKYSAIGKNSRTISASESRYYQNVSQKMITLSEMGEIDNLREANLQMTEEIKCLNQKIKKLENSLAAKVNEDQQRQKPIIIPLPISKQIQQFSQISHLINKQQLLLNSNQSQQSSKQQQEAYIKQQKQIHKDSSKIQQEISNILQNISSLSQQNSSLHKEIDQHKLQIVQKNKKISELQSYFQIINKYIKESNMLNELVEKKQEECNDTQTNQEINDLQHQI